MEKTHHITVRYKDEDGDTAEQKFHALAVIDEHGNLLLGTEKTEAAAAGTESEKA